MEAATQIFYSLGVAYGSLIAFASYNPIKSECNRDAITVCLVNCCVSVYASVVVFCFIGFQAHEKMVECESKQLAQWIGLMNDTHWVHDNKLIFDYNFLGDENKQFLVDLANVSATLNKTLIQCEKSVFLKQVSHCAIFVFNEG